MAIHDERAIDKMYQLFGIYRRLCWNCIHCSVRSEEPLEWMCEVADQQLTDKIPWDAEWSACGHWDAKPIPGKS